MAKLLLSMVDIGRRYKGIGILLLSFLQLKNASAQVKDERWDIDLVRKNVLRTHHIQSASIYGYHFNNKGKPIDSVLVKTIEYNDDGNETLMLVKRSTYADQKQFYEYNELKQLVRIKVKSATTGVLSHTIEFEYDSSGNAIGRFEFNKDTASVIIEFREFDAAGNLTSVSVKTDANDAVLSRKFYYDFKGRRKRAEIYEEGKRISAVFDVEFLDQERKEKIYQTTAQSRSLSTEIFYDGQGRVLQRYMPQVAILRGEIVSSTENYYYNAWGLEEQVDSYKGDQLIYRTRTVYNIR